MGNITTGTHTAARMLNERGLCSALQSGYIANHLRKIQAQISKTHLSKITSPFIHALGLFNLFKSCPSTISSEIEGIWRAKLIGDWCHSKANPFRDALWPLRQSRESIHFTGGKRSFDIRWKGLVHGGVSIQLPLRFFVDFGIKSFSRGLNPPKRSKRDKSPTLSGYQSMA